MNLKHIVTVAMIGLAGCGTNYNDLGTKVKDPDVYALYSHDGAQYVLAEGKGCIMAYTSEEDEHRTLRVFTGENCTNITKYQRIQGNINLPQLVRSGKYKGRVVERMDMTTERTYEEQIKELLRTYNTVSKRIKERHFN